MNRVRLTLTALAILGLLAAALLVTACGASTSAPARTDEGAAPSAQTAAVAPPTVRLTSPLEGAEVPAGEVAIAVETTGLRFVMPSNTNVPGEGHVHFTLDDKPFQMSTSPEFVLKDVAPGPHRLKAELVQNDTKSFDLPVKQEITFTAK